MRESFVLHDSCIAINCVTQLLHIVQVICLCDTTRPYCFKSFIRRRLLHVIDGRISTHPYCFRSCIHVARLFHIICLCATTCAYQSYCSFIILLMHILLLMHVIVDACNTRHSYHTNPAALLYTTVHPCLCE